MLAFDEALSRQHVGCANAPNGVARGDHRLASPTRVSRDAWCGAQRGRHASRSEGDRLLSCRLRGAGEGVRFRSRHELTERGVTLPLPGQSRTTPENPFDVQLSFPRISSIGRAELDSSPLSTGACGLLDRSCPKLLQFTQCEQKQCKKLDYASCPCSQPRSRRGARRQLSKIRVDT